MLYTASGERRYKVLAPWRFQSGSVRRGINQGDVSNPVRCGLEAPEVNLMAGRAVSGSCSDGDLGDKELQSGGGAKVLEGGGVGVGGDCGSDTIGGNAAAEQGHSLLKDSNFVYSEGLENNGAATEPVGAAQPSNLHGFQRNGISEGSNPAGKDYISEGFRTVDGTVLGCRKGRKSVVPWRFQIGYRPKWNKFRSGSDEQTDLLASMDIDGSKQYAPAMAGNPSRVEVSAARNHPLVKVQKGTGPVPKKRNNYKDSHRKPTVKRKISFIRENVMTTLWEFRVIYKKLLEEENTKLWEGGGLRPDIAAFNIYKERFCVKFNDQRYVGSILGVQIGDVFNSNMELSVVGIHHAPLLPVDHIINKKDGTCRAVSIVSYAQSSASNNILDFLLYVGSTTAMSDQNLEGTDLAVKQSMDTGTSIRVIHAVITESEDHSRLEQHTSYVYGGLYLVEKHCREKITGDQCVNTFHLRRVAGQQPIDTYEVLKKRNPAPSDGVFMADMSRGHEKMPISAINTISNEYPMAFEYMSQIQYPLKYQPDPPLGCNCVGGCSLSKKCACAVKNGGMFPFSTLGLLEDRPLIYECGPSCKCPPTCHNRVSQHGIKFRLQVFKTNSMGWGVRCLDFMPSGSYVCEYIGELIEEQEAQERISDEYLFATGNNYYDVPRWEGMLEEIPSLRGGPSEDEETVFAVDAINRGNIARFINHACTPNLFPQNVLYDHDDKRMPHIMFFASEDIPPLKELSYDYNYVLDAVHDSDGNIKKKRCFCGSVECTGWLY
jgi:hypothetical protein